MAGAPRSSGISEDFSNVVLTIRGIASLRSFAGGDAHNPHIGAAFGQEVGQGDAGGSPVEQFLMLWAA